VAVHVLTHHPTARLPECALTFREREPIDPVRAAEQHGAYCRTLRDLGALVAVLDVNADAPDGVFVEDTAVVLEGCTVLGRSAVASRSAEAGNLAPVLERHGPLHRIEAPGTLEGGDVLRMGKRLFVGRSPRTNPAGIEALTRIAGDYGYTVTPVAVTGALHLKTACTAPHDETVLMNPAWLDPAPFAAFRRIEVDPAEPWAANLLRIGGACLAAAGFSRTRRRLDAAKLDIRPVRLGEFLKAEGGPTCLSLVFGE